MSTDGSNTGLPRAQAATNVLSYDQAVSEACSSSALHVGPQGSPVLLYSPPLLSVQTPWVPGADPLPFQASASVKNLFGFHFLIGFLRLGFSFLKFSYPHNSFVLYPKPVRVCGKRAIRLPHSTLLPKLCRELHQLVLQIQESKRRLCRD